MIAHSPRSPPIEARDRTPPATDRSPGGEPFFLVLALFQLAVVLGGFAPTFYLRGDDLPPLSATLVLHGAFLTLWYLLVPAQAALLGPGRTAERLRWHRRLGVSSVAIVGGALVTGFLVSTGRYRRGLADEFLSEEGLLFANLANLAAFAVCWLAGVALRRRPAPHKRFMVVAGIVILGPAAFRFLALLGADGFLTIVLQGALVGVLALYDRRRLGRVHGATWIGLAFLVLQVGGSFTLGESEAWARIVERWLGE